MWCPTCQADVAAEVSADDAVLSCTTCGSEIRKVIRPSDTPEARSAREFLERWSRSDLPSVEPPPAPEAAASGRVFRTDAAHSDGPRGAHTRRVPAPTARRSTPQSNEETPDGKQRIEHEAHQSVAGPHFDVRKLGQPRTAEPGRRESMFGQLLAYGGVAVLTLGTTLILWGYFGGPADYAPTGWLVATAGQMLMFLGVVTLVSGGMQQTTFEVGSRVQFLGEQLERVERATDSFLKGPYFSQSKQPTREATAAPPTQDTDE